MASVTRVIVYIFVVAIFVAMDTEARKGNKKRKHEPPRWKVNSMPNLQEKLVSVVDGEELVLDCSAKGKPRPHATWFINGEKIIEDIHEDIELRKHILSIEQLKPADKGNYTCVVSNKLASLKWSFDVNVIRKIWPLDIEGPSNITSRIGESVTFTCRVKNDPNATIQWLKRHEPPAMKANDLNIHEKTQFIDSGPNPEYLIISDISEKDNGEYRCLAGNKWGVSYKIGYLNVISPTTTTELSTTTTILTTTTEKVMTTYFPPRRRQRPDPTDGIATFFPPHRKNGRGKKNRKKNRKNKQQTTTAFIYKEETTMYPMVTREWERGRDREQYKSTNSYERFPAVDDGSKSDVVYVSSENENQRKTGESNTDTINTISLWTIYTIVGSIAGIILLVGLVAITVALCCRRDGNGVYKSTPV